MSQKESGNGMEVAQITDKHVEAVMPIVSHGEVDSGARASPLGRASGPLAQTGKAGKQKDDAPGTRGIQT